MKTLLLNLWVWIAAHPAEVLGALYVALNAVNAAIPVERRKNSLALRVLDRLCIATQRGAVNASSWPVAGKSLAKEIASAVIVERETQAPPPPSEPGYAERSVLEIVAGVALLALGVLLVTGCSARDAIRRNVEPLGLYEVQHPLHGGCHELGVRAQSEALNREVIVYGGVCVGRIDAGAVGDAGVSE